MKAAALLIVVAMAISFAVLVVAALILAASLSDMVTNGPEFWNCFGILLVVAGVVAGAKASQS